jgi:hypothetical protein
MIDARDQKSLAEMLQEKVKILNGSIWERRANWPQVLAWLKQFKDHGANEMEQLNMLYLLSNFMYFGMNEIRALLRSLYRDIFRASIIAEIRKKRPTLRMQDVENEFLRELNLTRFVPLGNPSESSALLLYYFRQENSIPKDFFINPMDIFSLSNLTQPEVRNSEIKRYVFIDDMCGSGQQAEDYSEHIVVPLKRLKPDVRVYYFAMFGTATGIDRLRSLNRFDNIHPVVELDETFCCFSSKSRIYRNVEPPLELAVGRPLASRIGTLLCPKHPLGYENGQLLLGFAYNTPDNTLPIIWSDGTEQSPWIPIFKRYQKIGLINYG